VTESLLHIFELHMDSKIKMSKRQSNKKFRAIAFDHGGVLEFFGGGNPNIIAAEELNVPIDEFRKVYFKYNYLSNSENMPWHDMFRKVIAVFDDREETINRVMKKAERDNKNVTQNVELISWLSSLKKQGLLLAIFSNNTTSLRDRLTKSKIIDYFDEIVISGEIGFQKPQIEAFNVLFERLNVKAEEVIFIDDARASLSTSSEIGYTPILYESNEKLKSDLFDLGILI